MLLLHGRWGRARTWSDLMLKYGDRYRMLALEQRGHGLSAKPAGGYSPVDMARDAHDFLEQLDMGPAIVVGHSMGGRIAAFLAVEYPELVRACAILDCESYDPDKQKQDPGDESQDADPLTKDWPIPFATSQDALDFLHKTFKRETNVRYFADSLVETADGYDFLFSRHAMSAIERSMRGYYGVLPQIQCPTLVVRAAESIFLSAEEAADIQTQIKNCTYFEVSNSDHMVYADNPAEFEAGFERFLESLK
jgi:pimeloyl-ACP methyl ester carboxylesterase